MTKGKTFRVGLIGCGGMGRHHLEILKELDDFEIAALCDVVGAARDRTGEEYGIQARYSDFEEMYSDSNLDIVTVATQTRDHHAPTVAALKGGITVLCEKPIAIDLGEADEMVSAAAESGAKLAINQQNHVNPGILKAKSMIAEGVIGEIVLVRGRNKTGRKSGNEFMEMGTHVTDMMLSFGGNPEWCGGSIYHEGQLADHHNIMEAKEMSPKDRDSGLVMGTRAVAHYGFSSGILGEIHFLGYPEVMGENYGVDILGSEGQLAIRAVRSQGNLWHLPRPMEGTPAQTSDWRPVSSTAAAEKTPVMTMYRQLADAIQNDSQPPCNGEEGRSAFEMIMAIYQSHREDGKRVALPLADRGHPLEKWRREAIERD